MSSEVCEANDYGHDLEMGTHLALMCVFHNAREVGTKLKVTI
jgi:hypothetical protein